MPAPIRSVARGGASELRPAAVAAPFHRQLTLAACVCGTDDFGGLRPATTLHRGVRSLSGPLHGNAAEW